MAQPLERRASIRTHKGRSGSFESAASCLPKIDSDLLADAVADEGAMAIIYKIVTQSQWREAGRGGVFRGAPVDLADGFIHFSTAGQVAETAARHFSGQGDLVLVAVDEATLGEALKYEVSRGGALFPHLYADLPLSAVLWASPMPLGADGVHRLPAMDR